MTKNSLIKRVDKDNLIRIYILTHKLEVYGTSYKISKTDLDNLYKIATGYITLIERVNNYEKNR